MIDPIKAGRPVRHIAADENQLRALLDKASHPILRPGSSSHGISGIVSQPLPPGVQIILFELTAVLTYPTSSSSSGEGPDVPFSYNARRVWLDIDANQHKVIESPTDVLYHPVCFRDDADWPFGVPTFSIGQRVYAFFNPQSGRWEILARALDTIRYELCGTFVCGSSSGEGFDYSDSLVAREVAGELDGDPDMPVRVFDAFHSIRARGAAGTMQGALGYASYFPDTRHWESVVVQRSVWMGKLTDEVTEDGTVVVSIWWPNSETGVMEDSGCDVTAYHWLSATLPDTTRVILQYDEQYGQWYIISSA